MAFDDVRLPDDVEKGAQGGPQFLTTIIELSSGYEQRNAQWSQTRGEWDIGYGLRNNDQGVTDVIAFFYARQGRARGFRFKDWTDYQLSRQVIGLTDGATATFQAYKRYSSQATVFDRQLTKIVSDSDSLWVNNVAITKGTSNAQYQLNNDTGVVTLGATLAAQSSTNIELQCEFDVPVRFDTDKLNLIAETGYAASMPQIPIIEIRI